MDKTTILVLLCLAGCCTALEIGIYGETSYTAHSGQSLSFKCHLDQGLAVILNYQISWIHQSLADPNSPSDTVLTNQQTLVEEIENAPLKYDIKFDHDPNNVNITLTLKKVESSDDGKFICRATPTNDPNGEVVEAEIGVETASDVKSIELMFDGEDAVTGEDPTPVQREQGDSYGVTCTAKGFSPAAAQIHIFLGEKELSSSATEITNDAAASAADNARRYMATASATNIKLTSANNGEKLSCQSRAQYSDDTVTRVASIPLTIITYEPTIVCDKNVTAWVGDKYVKIICQVDYKDVEIEKFSWEIGSTGEIIYPGNITANHDEVTVDFDNDNRVATVTLDLYEVTEKNFQSAYYLDVYITGGQRFRETAMIIKNESTGGATSVVVSHSAVFFLCFLLSALFSL